jgi:DNA-directed RNA polymerase I subunit RPA1
MNLHFPQDEVSRAEAYGIVGTAHQYLSATAGTPLRGLIMDHNAICAVLTARDRLFGRDTFMQLLNAALSGIPGYTLPTASSRPVGATGKQQHQQHQQQQQQVKGKVLPPPIPVGVSLFPGSSPNPHSSASAAAAGGAAAAGTSHHPHHHHHSTTTTFEPRTLDIQLPTPAILLPVPLWTGKQLVSSLLRALSDHLPAGLYMEGKAKIKDDLWAPSLGGAVVGGGGGSSWKDVLPIGDSTVCIRDGYMLTGVLDKNSLGNTSYGLVHACAEVLGPQAAGTLLSSMGVLLTYFLNMHAQTCGLGDFILQPAAEAKRTALYVEGQSKGLVAMAAACGVTLDAPVIAASGSGSSSSSSSSSSSGSISVKRPRPNMALIRSAVRAKLRGGSAGSDVTGAAALDAAVFLDNTAKSVNNAGHGEVLKACLPYGLAKPFPSNQFALMVETGAKGSVLNFSMITVGLGQQELEGRRVPLSPLGKTLPCFPAFHASPRSGGYISDRFLTGLRPADYFFHCT